MAEEVIQVDQADQVVVELEPMQAQVDQEQLTLEVVHLNLLLHLVHYHQFHLHHFQC